MPGTPLPLRHADRIGIGAETVLFSWPAQLQDPDTTEPLEEVAPRDIGAQLPRSSARSCSALCGPWLAGASLETPAVERADRRTARHAGCDRHRQGALRRIYAKAGLSDQPAHAKRRALCRIARQRGWV